MISSALSVSPSASSSAFLTSIIPAPVFSRSALMSASDVVRHQSCPFLVCRDVDAGPQRSGDVPRCRRPRRGAAGTGRITWSRRRPRRQPRRRRPRSRPPRRRPPRPQPRRRPPRRRPRRRPPRRRPRPRPRRRPRRLRPPRRSRSSPRRRPRSRRPATSAPARSASAPASSSRSHSASGSASAGALGGRGATRVTLQQTVGGGVGDDAGQQLDGADRVVVARDRVVDDVGVAVGVEDRDDGDAELARLVDGEVLLVRVDDPHGRGNLGHVTDAAERLGQLVLLAAQDEQLLLREVRARHVVEVDLLELLEALETLVHRAEVGEHATEPALVDVRHADAGGLVGDRLLRLLLGADEEDRAAVRDGLAHEVVGVVDVRQRLLQVDDVDAVALGEDEALHLGVPAAGLVSEVDTALEQLAHGHDGHGTSFRRAPRGARVKADPSAGPHLGCRLRPAGRRPWRHVVVRSGTCHVGRCSDRCGDRPRPGARRRWAEGPVIGWMTREVDRYGPVALEV